MTQDKIMHTIAGGKVEYVRPNISKEKVNAQSKLIKAKNLIKSNLIISYFRFVFDILV